MDANQSRLQAVAAHFGGAYKLPFFVGQIKQESGFNPNARSPAGAQGIAQIVPHWHPDAPPASDPEGQLQWAAKYMSGLMQKYGNAQDALSVYNSGRPWAEGQKINETRNYVNTILGGRTAPSPMGPTSPTGQAPLAPGLGSGDHRAGILQFVNNILAAQQSGRPAPDFAQGILKAMGPGPTVQAPMGSGPGAPAGPGHQVALTVSAGKGVTTPAPAAHGIIGLAQQYIGTPYSWGGGSPTGPSKGTGRGANTVGFDCSSFAQFLYAKQGVSIPRTTYDQWKTGKAIPQGKLAAGDLVFFHPGSNGPEHVGIYAGNGQFFEAPHTGANVRISKLSSRPDFMGARRYS